jgi:hypothetical protein
MRQFELFGILALCVSLNAGAIHGCWEPIAEQLPEFTYRLYEARGFADAGRYDDTSFQPQVSEVNRTSFERKKNSEGWKAQNSYTTTVGRQELRFEISIPQNELGRDQAPRLALTHLNPHLRVQDRRFQKTFKELFSLSDESPDSGRHHEMESLEIYRNGQERAFLLKASIRPIQDPTSLQVRYFVVLLP